MVFSKSIQLSARTAVSPMGVTATSRDTPPYLSTSPGLSSVLFTCAIRKTPPRRDWRHRLSFCICASVCELALNPSLSFSNLPSAITHRPAGVNP